ncbi:MAG: LysR family transcriptional regulator [Lachnospiraceae bacterium]|nr:LysR family transcriptional regulator [Lachnospiraceae bacterium]
MFQGMEYVYAVYEEGSFSRAAAKLYISQPSLSASVKRIEEKVGYPLFDRNTKPVRLTECGEHYIAAVEKIMEQEREFKDFLTDWAGLNTGRLSLGGSNMFLSWVLAEMIRDYSAKYPLVEVDLVEENVTELMQMLHTGQIDVLIENKQLDRKEFDAAVYREEHLLLAVPRHFEINDRLSAFRLEVDRIRDGSYLKEDVPAVPLAPFAEEPFLMQKPENDTRQRADRILGRAKIRPKVLFEVDQQMTAYNITCAGLGVSFVSDTLISRMPSPENAIYYKLPGKECSRNIWFYWKHGRYMPRAMKAFLDMTGGRPEQTIEMI